MSNATELQTATGEKAVLPVWHDLDLETLVRYSSVLAGRLGVDTRKGVDVVVAQIARVLAK